MNQESLTRRRFLEAVGSGVAVAASQSQLHAAGGGSAGRPNVLVILVDDLGYGDLSCYGAKDTRTPNIDGLFSAGIRVDPFYANCPVCSPTRAALLTGRFPDLVGVPGVIRTKLESNFGHLSRDAVLLPSVLKRVGYDTAIVGKWHLGLASPNTPNERGFDYFHGFLGDMMDDYLTHRRHGINYMRLNDKEIDPKGHATDLFTDWSVEYIRGRGKSARPFFLYLAYNAPHSPIQPPQEWLDRVRRREKGISEQRAKIVALIEHLDDGIGKVLAALDAAGLSDNTLVIFTSDNGGSLALGSDNGLLSGGKQDMSEGGIREPMCAVWPGRITPGARTNSVMMTMDLFPTICEAAGTRFDHKIDGRSFLPTLLGRPQENPDRYLFWPRLEGGQRYKGRIYYAARYGNWKLLQNTAFEPYRLYDLKTDPREEHPFGPEHPQYTTLLKALKAHIERASKVPWQRPED
jgi:arylsulfatase A-like enzyme